MEEIKRIHICLEDPYHFPDWWILSNKYGIFIDLDTRKGSTSIFDGGNIYAGEDSSYKFYIVEYGVTEPGDSFGNTSEGCTLSLVIKCIMKENVKQGGKIQDRIKADYKIYPPFYVE